VAKHAGGDAVKRFSAMNGHAAATTATNDIARTDRGQTSAELKKRRSAQRQSGVAGAGAALTVGYAHDEYRLSSAVAVVDKKGAESAAVGSVVGATTFKRNATRRRCVVM